MNYSHGKSEAVLSEPSTVRFALVDCQDVIYSSDRMQQQVKNVSSKEQSSFDEVTKFYTPFFRMIGLIPLQGKDYNSIGTYLLLVYFLSSSIVNWSTMVSFCLNTNSLTVDSICETVLVVGANLRIYLFLPRRNEFKKLVEDCRELWKYLPENGHLTVIMFEKKIRMLFQFLLGSCVFVNVFYSVTALSVKLPAIEPNGTERRILPYRWYVDNPENLWPGYKMTFFIQLLVVNNTGILASTVDSAAPMLMMVSSGYLRVLQDRLLIASEKFVTASTDDEADQELVDCSKFHQGILDICARIERLTRTMFLVQLMGTGYNMSLIGLKIVGNDPDKYKYVSLFALNLGQLFACQWAPDFLIDESLGVSTAAYFASFTWMRRRIGKLMVIIIARAQRPIQMTAGGVVYLSLENFGNMLTSAMSFFTMLRSFNL